MRARLSKRAANFKARKPELYASLSLAMKPVEAANGQDGFKMLSSKYDEVTGYVVVSGICLAAVLAAGVAIRSQFRKASDFSQGKSD